MFNKIKSHPNNEYSDLYKELDIITSSACFSGPFHFVGMSAIVLGVGTAANFTSVGFLIVA